MHVYIPEQTDFYKILQEPCKHCKWNNSKVLYVYKTLEDVVNSPGYKFKMSMQNCLASTSIKMALYSVSTLSPMIDSLTKYQNQIGLLL